MHFSARSKKSRTARGFSLVEMMVVVAMIGVLASLAVVGYIRYVDWSNTAETKDILQMVTNGQEAYYADTNGYLNCSSGWNAGAAYPLVSQGRKHNMTNSGHPDWDCWKMLMIDTTEPSYVSLWTRAGDTAAFPSLPSSPPLAMEKSSIDMNPKPNRPWYVNVAFADVDDDGLYSFYVTHSGQPTQVHVENGGE